MQRQPDALEQESASAVWLRAMLLLVWAVAAFGITFFAHDLDQSVGNWPLNYWWAAQGAVLVFIAIVMVHAWLMNRAEAAEPPPADAPDAPGADDVAGGDAR